MNQTQGYMDVHSSHLASSQPYSQGPTESVAHYNHYPPLLHHGSYSHGSSYPPYGYANGVSSPATSQPMTNALAPSVHTTHLPVQPRMFLLLCVVITLLMLSSHGRSGFEHAWLPRESVVSAASTPADGHHRPDQPAGREAKGVGDPVGGRGHAVLPD